MKSILLNSPKKQTGLSLVELMVALLISTILLLGVLELFGSSSKTSRSANALARLQENGRLAMDLIAREARRTGFNGCDGGLDEEDKPLSFTNAADENIDRFPSESMAGSDDRTLRFRYFSASNGDMVDKNNCEKNKLTPHYIKFLNCGNNLCVQSSDTGGSQQTLLNHANFAKDNDGGIRYIQPCESPNQENTCYYSAGAIPTKTSDGKTSFRNVQKIQVKLKLCTDTLSENSSKYCADDSTTKITRTFSSIIELRNRL